MRTSAYRLGPALTRLAAMRDLSFSMRDTVKPLIDALSREIGELVHCSVFDGRSLQAIYHAQHHDHGLRVQFEDSEQIPLHATSSGVALLARLPETDWPTLLSPPLPAFTDRTPTDQLALTELLRDVRSIGHSEMKETREAGVSSIGAPVFDSQGQPCAAISITYPSQRDKSVRNKDPVTALLRTAAKLTHALGGELPDDLAETWAA